MNRRQSCAAYQGKVNRAQGSFFEQAHSRSCNHYKSTMTVQQFRETMSRFQKDDDLLCDMDELVNKIEKQAQPDPAALFMLGAMNPILKATTPRLGKKAKKGYDTIAHAMSAKRAVATRKITAKEKGTASPKGNGPMIKAIIPHGRREING